MIRSALFVSVGFFFAFIVFFLGSSFFDVFCVFGIDLVLLRVSFLVIFLVYD